MSYEHPIQQPIRTLVVFEHDGGHETYQVGFGGITRIEACTKSGLHADIPYVRVWKGEEAVAEFCQHNIRGVYFDPPQEPGEPTP